MMNEAAQEQITQLVQFTYKNFVPAKPMVRLNPFLLGREARRMNVKLPQNVSPRVQAGWQFADMRMKVGAE